MDEGLRDKVEQADNVTEKVRGINILSASSMDHVVQRSKQEIAFLFCRLRAQACFPCTRTIQLRIEYEQQLRNLRVACKKRLQELSSFINDIEGLSSSAFNAKMY